MASDSDGFTFVTRGRRPKQRQHAFPVRSECSLPCEEIVSKIQRIKDSDSLIAYSSLVSDLLLDVCCNDIICYGIGCFETCHIAQQQLALLLHIASVKQARKVLVYDPVLRPQEKAALEELDCSSIHHNELCQRKVQEHTLFYMPHCGRAMYNNLLWANWVPQHLSKVAIIGNSLGSYLVRTPHRQLMDQAFFIFKATEYCTERPLPSYIEDPTVFNDLSVHTFPMSQLHSAPPELWAPCPPPHIHPSDPEIIT